MNKLLYYLEVGGNEWLEREVLIGIRHFYYIYNLMVNGKKTNREIAEIMGEKEKTISAWKLSDK